MLGRGLTSICHSCRHSVSPIQLYSRRRPQTLIRSTVCSTVRFFANHPSKHKNKSRPATKNAKKDTENVSTKAEIIQAREDRVLAVRRQWGDNLPKDELSEDDYDLYKALYGPPVKLLDAEEAKEYLASLEVTDDIHDGESQEVDMITKTQDGTITVTVTANSQEEAEQYRQLRRDMQKAAEKSMAEESERQEKEQDIREEEEEYEENEEGMDERDEDGVEDVQEGSETQRYHPLTLLGQFSTSPSTVFMPPDLDNSLKEVMKHAVTKHIKAAAKNLKVASVGNREERWAGKIPNLLHPEHDKLGNMEAHVFITAVFPEKYATTLSTLTECRKRLGGQWVKSVKRVLDCGPGGAAIMAWRNIVQAERQSSDFSKRDATKVGTKASETSSTDKWWYENEGTPESKQQQEDSHGFHATVVAGSYSLRSQLKQILDSTTFIPRLPDPKYHSDVDKPRIKWEHNIVVKAMKSASSYDLIVASDTFPTRLVGNQSTQHVKHLWSLLNPGGVLILQEAGTAQGFENIAAARAKFLKLIIKSPENEGIQDESGFRSGDEEGMIVAPCTNHRQCPMFISGRVPSSSRKDFCHFSQRWSNSGVMNFVTGRTGSYVDTAYSYLALRRGQTDIRPLPPAETASVEVQSGQTKLDKLQETLNKLEARGEKQYHKQIEKKMRAIRQQMGIETKSNVDVTKEPELVPAGDSDDLRPMTIRLADKIAESQDANAIRQFMLSQPRLVNKPIKATGHVILDVCTHTGTLERWTIPKSFSKLAFHDVRKAKWGDIWALGAKSRIPRDARVGKLKRKTDGARQRLIVDGNDERVVSSGPDGKVGKYGGKARRQQSQMLRRTKEDREQLAKSKWAYRTALKRKDIGDQDWNKDVNKDEIKVPRYKSKV